MASGADASGTTAMLLPLSVKTSVVAHFEPASSAIRTLSVLLGGGGGVALCEFAENCIDADLVMHVSCAAIRTRQSGLEDARTLRKAAFVAFADRRTRYLVYKRTSARAPNWQEIHRKEKKIDAARTSKYG